VIYKLSNKRVVVKFGGSSIGDSFKKAVELVLKLHEENEVVVVLSALKGVTDALLDLAESKDESIIEEIAKKHEKLANKSKIDLNSVEILLAELKQVLRNEKSFPNKKAFIDHVLSFGERLSVNLFANVLKNSGIEGEAIDAFHIIRTDNSFGNAKVNLGETAKRVKVLEDLLKQNKVPVVTGFLGGYKSFRTTLGRGGSDYTATILGSLLEARAVLIMSDVKGIYTADPKIVRDARLLPFASYEEVLTASMLGMKALHERAIESVKGKIPIILGKTNNQRLGTLISKINAGMPILAYKIINENLASVGVVGVNEVNLNAQIYKRGRNWICFLVRREELENTLNAIHEVIFQ